MTATAAAVAATLLAAGCSFGVTCGALKSPDALDRVRVPRQVELHSLDEVEFGERAHNMM